MNSEFGKNTIPHLNLLFTYALLVTGDNRKAEKILSQTFAKAFRFWKHLSDENDTRLWLLKIMMNIFGNNPADPQSGDMLILKNKLIDLSSLDNLDIDKELDFQKTNHLSHIISSLPLSLKEVIIFVDVFKFSIGRVADLTEVPEDVIRERLFDARKVLLYAWLQKKIKRLPAGEVKISLKEKILIINSVNGKELDDLQNDKVGLLKNEIEYQSFVKNMIAKNISIQSVREVIKLKLVNKYASELKDEIKKTSSPERRSIVRVATFAMVILLTILILLFRPTLENPAEYAAQQIGEDNIFVQLKNNYSLFVDGNSDSDLIIGDESKIKEFLSTADLKYKSIFPKFTGWDIESLFITSYKDVRLTNLIFNNEAGRNLYLYLVPLQFLEQGKIFQLTPELMEYLNSYNCYSFRDGTTFYVLKKTGGHILGFALENPQKEEIIEICSKSYNITL
jgi:RNA polymerase sigma-70 factor (ECF subfamily)